MKKIISALSFIATGYAEAAPLTLEANQGSFKTQNLLEAKYGRFAADDADIDESLVQLFTPDGDEYFADMSEYLASLKIETSNETDDANLTRTKLEDLYDMQIYTKTYFGSEKEPFNLIFDSGSNWVWVFAKNCTDCPKVPYFNNATSSSFETDFKNNSIHYGKGSVYGIEARDQVCLNTSVCAQNFSFLLVDNETELSGLAASGLVGLSPKQYDEGSDLFISKMYEAGAIDEKVFSFSIASGDDQSYITFGGYDLERFASPNSTVTWHDIKQKSPFWQLRLDMLRMNFTFTNGTEHYWSLGVSRPAIVDSGTSFILMPVNDTKLFIAELAARINVTFSLNVIPMVHNCSNITREQFPDLEFVVNGLPYVVPKDSYLLYDDSEDTCYLKIMTNKNSTINFWILGLNFFENYYTIFDQEQQRVGFAPSIHAKPLNTSKPVSMLEGIIDEPLSGEAPTGGATTAVGLAIGVLSVGALIGLVSMIICRKKTQVKEADSGQKTRKKSMRESLL